MIHFKGILIMSQHITIHAHVLTNSCWTYMNTHREYHTDYSYPIKLAALTHTSLWIVNWITPTQERSRTSSRSTDRYDVYSVTHRFLPRCWLLSLITDTDLRTYPLWPIRDESQPRWIDVSLQRKNNIKLSSLLYWGNNAVKNTK